MTRGIAAVLTLIAVGCGARTGAEVPSGAAVSVDAGVRLPDAGLETADAGRRPGGVFVPSPPTRLAAGTRHTCAVVDGGRVRCWGLNHAGQLGVPGGSMVDFVPPTSVPGIDDAVEVTAGSETSCARHASGEVSCWGRLAPGRDVSGPQRVPGVDSAVELTSGNFHSCALISGGRVVCWGENAWGQLGDGSTTRSDTPVPVLGLDGVDEITAGWDHTCARSGGAVSCWGHNEDGQLGDGTFDPHRAPTPVAAELAAVEIAAGWSHTCARSRDGEVHCWGRRWGESSLMSTELHTLIPTRVEGLDGVVEIDAGGAHTCARDTEGVVHCWGRNYDGQLGDGTMSRVRDRTEPTPVIVLGRTDEIVAGWVHNCAREGGGRVLCWGSASVRDSWLGATPRVIEGL